MPASLQTDYHGFNEKPVGLWMVSDKNFDIFLSVKSHRAMIKSKKASRMRVSSPAGSLFYLLFTTRTIT